MLHNHADMRDNHQRFLERVIAGETVWGLETGHGWASCESNEKDDRDVIMLWSDRAYAERAKTGEFSDCDADSLSLFDVLFRWLPGMAEDGVLAGPNWTADLAGLEVDPLELQDQLIDQMPAEMLTRYRDDLQKGLEEQNRSD